MLTCGWVGGVACWKQCRTSQEFSTCPSGKPIGATGNPRFWRDQDKRGEARDLLAPVYVWFTEGFDTRDLKEAKAVAR